MEWVSRSGRFFCGRGIFAGGCQVEWIAGYDPVTENRIATKFIKIFIAPERGFDIFRVRFRYFGSGLFN